MKNCFKHPLNHLVILISAIFLIIPGKLSAQKVISLKECYDAALSANALSGEKEAYSEISGIKTKNINKGWLPSVDLNGSLLYNSEVIDMGSVLGAIPVPGLASAIKPLPHEQYKITLDINQPVYDGGAIKGAREMEKAELNLNQKQTETDLYRLRGQINVYYFNLMLIDRQKELFKTYLEVISKRISSVTSALENGVMLKSDIDVLNSERIRIEQQLSENEVRRESLVRILSDITGLSIDSATQFIIPEFPDTISDEINRPELQLFDMRKEQLSAGLSLIESKRRPKAFGFATLGYGNPPGSNFFRNEFAPYYIVGAGVKWNIIDWNKSKNEKQIISMQQDILENRKKDLNDNLKRQLESKMADINAFQEMISSDNELIQLRKRITATSESQYKNGTITATEYINVLNSERQSMINLEIHKVNLAMARAEYMNISGKETE
jgi:outer membrane protein TolC